MRLVQEPNEYRKIFFEISRKCQQFGIDYWIPTSPTPELWGHITGEGVRFADGCRTLARNGWIQIRLMVRLWEKRLWQR